MSETNPADSATPEQRKADAEARKAEAEAAKAEREEREAASPAAVARRATAADDEAAKARRDSLTSALPDLGTVTRGDLTVGGDGGPAAGTGVAGAAISEAAGKVVDQVVKVTGADDWTVLVTNDVDLVGAEATLLSVEAGITRLDSLAETAREAADQALGATPSGLASLGLALAAAGQLIPGILSLLSTPKTVTTGKLDFDDLTAAVAVAGRLKGGNAKRHVVHETFRLLPEASPIADRIEALRTDREHLATQRGRLEAAPTPDPTTQPAAGTVTAAEALGLVIPAIAAIDTFLQQVETIPTGATRSPRVTAMLQEWIRTEEVRVLLVKAHSASGAQLVANNLIADDAFSVVAAATISWMLTDRTGEILSAGLATGTAQAGGRIGQSFRFLT